MKQRIRLTESDLHRIVKESVKRVLKESGEYLEKEMDLPKGGGKYALAKKAAALAYKQGRGEQGSNLEDYADDYFNDTFGFNNDGNDFRINGMRRAEFNGEMIPSHNSPNQEAVNKREQLDKKMNNLKAFPRMKARIGMETYDKVRDAKPNW